MSWIIDNNRPVYIQLVEQLKFKIISGEFKAGQKIDSVRVLAQDAQVNPNTMQKALAELERQNLFFSKRTSWRFVTDKNLERLGFSGEEIIDFVIANIRG